MEYIYLFILGKCFDVVTTVTMEKNTKLFYKYQTHRIIKNDWDKAFGIIKEVIFARNCNYWKLAENVRYIFVESTFALD